MLRQAYCKFCALVASLLDNPYQYSGQVVAKLSVNLATMIWALVVLLKPDALARWPAPLFVDNPICENILAGALLLLTVIATIRLVYKASPRKLGACVYGIFLLLWLYTLATLLIAVQTGITAARPGQLAGVAVVTILAVFAFVSNPKRHRDGSPSA